MRPLKHALEVDKLGNEERAAYEKIGMDLISKGEGIQIL